MAYATDAAYRSGTSENAAVEAAGRKYYKAGLLPAAWGLSQVKELMKMEASGQLPSPTYTSPSSPGDTPTDTPGAAPSNLSQASQYYVPGGQFSQYMMKQWEGQAAKALPTYKAGLTSSGLGGTTLAGKAAPGYGGEERATYRSGVEATAGQNLINIASQQEGFSLQKAQLQAQKDMAAASLASQEKQGAARLALSAKELAAQERAQRKAIAVQERAQRKQIAAQKAAEKATIRKPSIPASRWNAP